MFHTGFAPDDLYTVLVPVISSNYSLENHSRTFYSQTCINWTSLGNRVVVVVCYIDVLTSGVAT